MILALLLSLLSVLQSPDHTPTPRVKVEVNLVLVDAQVTEKNTGRIIAGLDKPDFVLKDNGESREVAVIEPATVPLDLVLLWDTSNGPGGYPQDVYDGPPLLLQQLQAADRIAVISFDTEVRVQTPLTADHGLAQSAIHRALYEVTGHYILKGWDVGPRIYGSNLYGALVAASHLFVGPRTEPRRRAVLVVTHNRGAFYPPNPDPVTTALLEADATVEALVVDQELVIPPTIRGRIWVPGKTVIWGRKPERRIKPRMKMPGRSVDPIAEATGGEVFHYDPTTQTKDWWREAIKSLRSRYLLGFYTAPSNSKLREFRVIQVELSEKAKAAHPHALVRAARGYYIE